MYLKINLNNLKIKVMSQLFKMVLVDCSDENNVETIPMDIVLGETCLEFNESQIYLN